MYTCSAHSHGLCLCLGKIQTYFIVVVPRRADTHLRIMQTEHKVSNLVVVFELFGATPSVLRSFVPKIVH